MRERIQYLLKQGNYYQLIVDSYGSNDPVVLHARAIAHREKKDYINSVNDATKALELSRSSSKVTLLALRGMSFFSLGLYQKALEDYLNALSDPNTLSAKKTLNTLGNLLKGKGMMNQDPFDGQQDFTPPKIPRYLPIHLFQPLHIQINHNYYLNPNQNNQTQTIKKRKIHEIQDDNSLNFPNKVRKKNSNVNFFEKPKKSNNKLELGKNIEKAIVIEDDEEILSSKVIQQRKEIWFQPSVERLRIFFNQASNDRINEISQEEYKKFLAAKNNSEYGNYDSYLVCDEKSKIHIQAYNAFSKKKYSRAIELYEKALIKASPIEKLFVYYDMAAIYSQNKKYDETIWILYDGYCVIRDLEKNASSEEEYKKFHQEALLFLFEIQKNIRNLSLEKRLEVRGKDFLEENLKSDFEYYSTTQYKPKKEFYNNPTLEQYEAAVEMFSDDPKRFPNKLFSPKFFNEQFTGEIEIKHKNYRDPSKLDDTICARIMYELFRPEDLKAYLEKITLDTNVQNRTFNL